MAGISTSIQIADRMTPVLQSITSSMNIMLSTFSAAETAACSAFNAASIVVAQQQIANASAELIRYQEELERMQNAPIKTPEASWAAVSSPQVFMNRGSARFEAEMQSANQMAQQLYRTQQAISAQARQLRITPPGMLNDVAMVENRMQSLANRVQELNNIPVDLQTDRTNHELESLRMKLTQAVDVQENLNQAMGRMDVSAANTAYQRLNSIIGSAEQGIRDNFSAQEQFNQSMRRGHTAATGLEQTVRRVATAVLSVATAGKIIGLADEVSQTNARLGLLTNSLEETHQLQNMIYQSAQSSRAPYMDMVNIVARLGNNAKGVFSSNAETVAFAEQLNKQFVLAGASIQEQQAATLQLSQAMASGVLRGEELNSVFEQAPTIIQSIADYMQVPIGQIREMAAQGQISGEIVKNAMFYAADETNRKFSEIPMTFGQIASAIGNQALMAFQPALQQLSAVAQTAEFQNMVNSITLGIQMLANAAVTGLDLMAQAAVWVQDNWSWLLPVIAGVTAAIVAYNIASALHAFFTGMSTLAIFLQIAAINGLTAAFLACPIMWVVLLIGLAIAAIVAWINHIGGLQAAWLTCVNAVKTAGDSLKLAFSFISMHIQNSIANIQYVFECLKVGVLNALSHMKVMGLTIVENFLNGVIDRINQLIALVNNIPGVSIQAIGQVELVANSAAEERIKIQQRADNLAAMKDENSAAAKARQQDYAWQKLQRDAAHDQRAWEARQAGNKANSNNSWSKTLTGGANITAMPFEGIAGGVGDIAGNTGNTAGNTARMADSMEMAEEDLKYLRDAAEQEVINRFTTAELTVHMGGITNQVNSQMDLDGINSYLEASIFEVLETAAEGVY